MFSRLFMNTLILSFMGLIVGFPAPIILALLLNQVQGKRYKKTVQTVTYAPHFISMVVMVGMMSLIFSPNSGIVNKAIVALGGEKINFMSNEKYFRWMYVLSGVWQSAGWGSIIYLAALSSVDPGLYEAARIDGCNRFGLVLHIDIPSIIPTCVIMFIMDMGRLMSLGYQKAYLMQNDLNIAVSEIIDTYVYKIGLINNQFSYSAAIGLFTTVINIALLVFANWLSRRVTEESLW
jgi:putative aldouronate transport system permease protein